MKSINIRSKGQKCQCHRVTKCKNILKAIEWPEWVMHSVECPASSYVLNLCPLINFSQNITRIEPSLVRTCISNVDSTQLQAYSVYLHSRSCRLRFGRRVWSSVWLRCRTGSLRDWTSSPWARARQWLRYRRCRRPGTPASFLLVRWRCDGRARRCDPVPGSHGPATATSCAETRWSPPSRFLRPHIYSALFGIRKPLGLYIAMIYCFVGLYSEVLLFIADSFSIFVCGRPNLNWH